MAARRTCQKRDTAYTGEKYTHVLILWKDAVQF